MRTRQPLLQRGLIALLLLLTFTTGALASAGAPVSFAGDGDTLAIAHPDGAPLLLDVSTLSDKQARRLNRVARVRGFGENKKLTAVLLAVALGTFGVHRLYLGTKPIVPVVYTLTLGGGFGILPLTDIIAILATPDISRFENNNQVIMWINPE